MDNNENKKNDGFGKGIILIVIGIFALMLTFFEIDIDWDIMADLWPLLLIIIGVCIMPINKWIKTVIALILLAFGCVMYSCRTKLVEKQPRRIEMIKTTVVDDDDF